ncbi:HepT-like ribonuclease domain-containing protein [Parapedobacter soli]|nr:HepT-like ribonuclease domain-containing protein [Parapedobacter soli]
MTNTRHRLIHDYFGVDYEIVWNIIVEKLPELKDDIIQLLKESRS